MKIYRSKKRITKAFCLLFAAFMIFVSGFAGPSTSVQAAGWPEGPTVDAESAIVMDCNTGTILYEKNSHAHQYPASITKIMTAMLAIENLKLSDNITFSYEATHNIDEGSSSIARDTGEVMTVEQTLYGLMLESANECANALAEEVSGSNTAFASLMNVTAEELGCTDTHFVNPSGLPNENHYTSAYDMALIGKAAIQSSEFRTIIGTAKYTIPPTNKHSDPTYLNNHHQMISRYKGPDNLYEYALGGKTGYTVAAGNTLVTFAEKGDMLLVCVVMKTTGHYADTRTLFDYCFNHYNTWNIAEYQGGSSVVSSQSAESLIGFKGDYVGLDSSGYVILPTGVDFSEAQMTVVTGEEGSGNAATIEYTYDGRTVGSASIEENFASFKPYKFGNAQIDLEDEEVSAVTRFVGKVLEIRQSIQEGVSEIEISREVFYAIIICIAVVLVALIILIILLRRMARERKARKKYKRGQELKRQNSLKEKRRAPKVVDFNDDLDDDYNNGFGQEDDDGIEFLEDE